MSKQKKSRSKRIGLLLTMVMVFTMVVAPVTPAVAADTGWINAVANDNYKDYVEHPERAYGNGYAIFDTHVDRVDYTFENNIVPEGANIDGIQIRLKAKSSRSAWYYRPFYISLMVNNTVVSSKKCSGDLSDDWEHYTLGGTSINWDYSGWTTEIINSQFKVRVATEDSRLVDSYLDNIELRVTYSKSATDISVESLDNPSIYGQSVAFTAKDIPSDATGTVQFFANDSLIGSADVSGGSASISTSSLPADSYTIRAEYSGDAGYAGSSGTCSHTVTKADATIEVNGKNVVYNGEAHGASGTATGADGSDLTSLINFGETYTNVPGGTANWSFPGDANHNPKSDSVEIVINKADADINIEGKNVVYNGEAHGASGTATGANGSDLTSLLHLGNTFTNVPGGTANWTFDGDANHNPKSDSVEIVISKADADINVEGKNVLYDGNEHGATGTATGADGSDLTSLLHLGDKFTNVPGGTAEWTFEGDDNHNPKSDSVEIVISKAGSGIEVSSNKSPSTYWDSVTFTATISPITATGTVEFFSDETSIGSANVSSSGIAELSTSVVPAGTHEIKAVYSGDINYSVSESTCSQTVYQAEATINVEGKNVPYDGNEYGATGTATGADGSDLTSLLHLGDKFTNVPGGTAEWTFDGDDNHKSDNGSVDIVINKAEATINVEGKNVPYDGNEHGATGTATGADGSDLTSLLDLGEKYTNVPGGDAHWTFDGDDNHNSDNGSVNIIISKADTGTEVTSNNNPSTYGEFVTFTATVSPSTATGTVQFYIDGSEFLEPALVNNGTATMATSTLSAGNHTIKAVYSGAANYNTSEGELTQVVNKADAAIVVQGVTVTYDGTSHSAIGTATGADGSDLSLLLNLGSSYTDVPGGTADWSFPGDANHNSTSGSVDIVINKATLAVKADNKTVTYDDKAPHYTVSYSGFKASDDRSDLNGSPKLKCSYERGDSGGSYPITVSQDTLSALNYDFSFSDGNLYVNKVRLTVTADNKTVNYGDAAPTYTARYSGFKGGDDEEDLNGTLTFGCAYAAGSPASGSPYSIRPGGLSSGKYTIVYVPGALMVNAPARAAAATTVAPTPAPTPSPSVSPSPSPTPAPGESATPPADTGGNDDTVTINENDVPAGAANAKGTGFFTHWWSWMILAIGLLLLLLVLLLILSRRRKKQEQH